MAEKTYDDNKGQYNVVTLIDENGKEVQFDHVLTFIYENARYVALLPIDEVEGIGENEVLIMRIVPENGEDTYEIIEDEELLDKVFDEFLRLIEEMENDDEDE